MAAAEKQPSFSQDQVRQILEAMIMRERITTFLNTSINRSAKEGDRAEIVNAGRVVLQAYQNAWAQADAQAGGAPAPQAAAGKSPDKPSPDEAAGDDSAYDEG
jgi:hypothetical protein